MTRDACAIECVLVMKPWYPFHPRENEHGQQRHVCVCVCQREGCDSTEQHTLTTTTCDQRWGWGRTRRGESANPCDTYVLTNVGGDAARKCYKSAFAANKYTVEWFWKATNSDLTRLSLHGGGVLQGE